MDSKDDSLNTGDSLVKMVEYALLYDFYGALLKDKNRSIFEDYMFNDMTLSEVACETGITRQGVRDVVNRSKLRLEEFEKRLGLVKRFNKVRESAADMKKELSGIKECLEVFNSSYPADRDIIKKIDGHINNIDSITDDILDEF